MGPTGIEPVPLVLQTCVRTSYTKGPIVGHCGIEPHLLTEPFYRPLITPVTEASQFLYLVIESNYRPLHVKQIRFHYANEAIFVPPEGNAPSSRY